MAGPIERSERLIPQLQRRAPIDVARWKTGLFLILWGFFKKTVLADNLALYVNLLRQSCRAYGIAALDRDPLLRHADL